MSEALAWSAGFIDGEGSFCLQSKGSGRSPILCLQAAQTDRRVLDKLRAALGMGKVYGPYKRKGKEREHHSEFFYYRLLHVENVDAAAAMLWPYLSEVKQEQYITALRRHDDGHRRSA